ncbi:MAG: hypothetical protein UY13_C0002G0140 [Candidatus Pacebacteria bacterium GW2011_GWB1_47_8]|nr:MAG: hypothetical protein UX28_C0001G0289 [Candidatus Pacebacteria bacterium GW2011_GWA1_46_10]KKU84228.1 MAG: hypothetical protein UY13_C0002G0140 [Candidatus Pacebacteria bacterium GW2011_GWB1_47_8]HCR81448.1 chromate transporter [Candidatus Paceibacterota bacterium]
MAKPTKTTTVSTAASLGQLEKVLEEYLVKKAPALPTNLKELLVKFAPYLAIIGVVLSVPALFTALSAGAWLSRNYYWAMTGATLGWQYYLALALSAVTVALEAFAIPGLFGRKMSAWKLLFYAVLVNTVYSLVYFNLAGLILGTLLSLYLLFQVRSYYH